MEKDEDWELMPHHQIENIKRDVERLKKNPFAGTSSGGDLLEAIDKLNSNINELMEIFKMAHEEMGTKEIRGEDENIEKLSKKVDRLADENRKIAQGIIGLADLVKRNVPHQPQPQMIRPLRRPPEISPGATQFNAPGSKMPPPPPSNVGEEKKNLFDRFKK